MSLGRLKTEEKAVLNYALEHYIRLGLGQLSDIANRLSLLLLPNNRTNETFREVQDLLDEAENKLGGAWTFNDPRVTRYTLVALLLQARLNDDDEAIAWVKQRLAECPDNPRK